MQRPLSKDAFGQVLKKLAQRFWRSKWKCDSYDIVYAKNRCQMKLDKKHSCSRDFGSGKLKCLNMDEQKDTHKQKD